MGLGPWANPHGSLGNNPKVSIPWSPGAPMAPPIWGFTNITNILVSFTSKFTNILEFISKFTNILVNLLVIDHSICNILPCNNLT